MVVKVFGGEEFSEHEREWNQFKEVFNLINEKYANTDELVYVLSNFHVSGTQIDVLILRGKGIAILDLKSYEGKIIGSENGEWRVIDKNGNEIPLKKNLFRQLQSQKFALLEKLNLLRQKGNLEHIEEDKLARIKCWGYFEKGSTYDINQVGSSVHIWFDVITADNLIEKTGFLNAGYMLRQEDMDAIVKGLNLKVYSFEKPSPPTKDDIFESNYKKQLSVFVPPENWDKIIVKIKDSNILTIVGAPKVGKTTAIVNIAKELIKSGYKIREKELLKKHFNSTDEKDRKEFLNLIRSKNIFILDNLFGDSEYEPSLGDTWVKVIVEILESKKTNSKFIVGSRKDVINNFLFSNPELRLTDLENAFKSSIVELNTSNYDAKKREEIFKKNLDYIQLKEDKKIILNKNIEKITKTLVLPGEIWHFLKNVSDNIDEFHEIEIDNYIDKAKRQVNYIKEQIKNLKDHEKVFLYILYINQNLNIEDLDTIYSHYLPSDFGDHFRECKEKFQGNFTTTRTVEPEHPLNTKVRKLEFVDDSYKEAIERLINSEEFERRGLEEILGGLYKSIRERGIVDWKQNDARYEEIKFNIYKIVLKHYQYFNVPIRDLVFEILSNLDFKKSADAMWYYYYADFDTPLTFVGGNIKYLKELFFYNYNKLSDEEIKWLLSLGIQTSIIHLLAYYYDEISKISKDLKNLLTTLISNTNQLERIETGKAILFSYNFLPPELTRYYDFMFDLKEELVIKQVGKAFTSWFMGAFTAINYDQKCENIDGKVFELYNNWLKNEKIISANYDEISDLYGEEYMEGWLVSSIYHYKEDNYSNSVNPKWNDSRFSKLKEAIGTNMVMLLNSSNSPISKGVIYGIAFYCYLWNDNAELIKKISNILYENDEIKLVFLDELHKYLSVIRSASDPPFKITVSQIEILGKLSEPPNHPEIRAKTKEQLNYIHELIENKIIKKIPNDYS